MFLVLIKPFCQTNKLKLLLLLLIVLFCHWISIDPSFESNSTITGHVPQRGSTLVTEKMIDKRAFTNFEVGIVYFKVEMREFL